MNHLVFHSQCPLLILVCCIALLAHESNYARVTACFATSLVSASAGPLHVVQVLGCLGIRLNNVVCVICSLILRLCLLAFLSSPRDLKTF